MKADDTYQHVFALHALASYMLIGQVFDLLVQYLGIFQHVDQHVPTVGDTHQLGAPLGTVAVIHVHSAEQSF